MSHKRVSRKSLVLMTDEIRDGKGAAVTTKDVHGVFLLAQKSFEVGYQVGRRIRRLIRKGRRRRR